jgi:hypothetical protein
VGGGEEGGGGGGERQEREGTQQDEADDGLAVIQRYEFSELMREVDRETAGLCCSKGLWLHRRRRGKPLRRNSRRWPLRCLTSLIIFCKQVLLRIQPF